ncbi:helix-turn-helix domain-containing protein [Microbulbifer sp. OS29]|uniref:Helix-turn-helix domain-containing protein n=1 Tax=Microbulbifer okhotskensis TaxID=2926617 RepID=A0A9X2EVF0_9GAMM|nr:helix-turn-helix transcriptional regulator [Microbulbifer okhotskensis]MCO1336668.1 helix-turn-helix domain-containing protein [Microbulbifer okhotskensis]
MSFYGQSDSQILETLGSRLKGYRLRMNLTQDDMAERAGLSPSTIKGLEAGRGRLDSLVAALRVLHQLESLEAFLPPPSISPMQIATLGKPRKRASRSSQASNNPSAIKKRDKPKW